MITAIVLAAGRSTRMGKPKMLLPWEDTTIIEHVISIFAKAGIEDILVVTGGVHEQVEAVIIECRNKYPVRSVYNDKYMESDMLSSIQCGLHLLSEEKSEAAMIGLGDQPQIQARSVQLLHEAYLQTKSRLVAPSFQMQRGHPWLVAQSLWHELIAMDSTLTPRDFLNAHAKDIQYVEMNTPSIMADLDTPEDYRASRP